MSGLQCDAGDRCPLLPVLRAGAGLKTEDDRMMTKEEGSMTMDDGPMTTQPLPPNVYRLPQKDFAAIPGSPWTYALSSSVRHAFRKMNSLEKSADIVLGMKTSDNFRFVR